MTPLVELAFLLIKLSVMELKTLKNILLATVLLFVYTLTAPKFHFYNNFLKLTSCFLYNLNFKTSTQKHRLKKT